MHMERTDERYTIRAEALGLDILVCETDHGAEAARRWDNTLNDLSDLQRIGHDMIKRGRPAAAVVSCVRRMTGQQLIPVTNYIG